MRISYDIRPANASDWKCGSRILPSDSIVDTLYYVHNLESDSSKNNIRIWTSMKICSSLLFKKGIWMLTLTDNTGDLINSSSMQVNSLKSSPICRAVFLLQLLSMVNVLPSKQDWKYNNQQLSSSMCPYSINANLL